MQQREDDGQAERRQVSEQRAMTLQRGVGEGRELAEGEVRWNLLHAVRTIFRGRWLLLGTTLIGVAAGLAVALLTKPYFESSAVFMPPKTAVAAGGAEALFGGGDEQSDVYLGLLRSRTVLDDVADHVGLLQRLHLNQRWKARVVLIGATTLGTQQNSLITVTVTNTDAKLAAAIANAYLDALYRLNGQMVETASEHRRTFFEQQLEQQKVALNQAEVALKQTQEKTGVVTPSGEVQANLNTITQQQAQLDSAQNRLSQLELSGTDQNPEVIEQKKLVSELEGQLARQQGSSGTGEGVASNRQLPGLALQDVQLEREVKLRESLYDELVKDYESARLESIDPGPQLQVVDYAIPAEQKSGPSRRKAVTIGFLLGLGFGLAYLLLREPALRLVRLLREPALTAGG